MERILFVIPALGCGGAERELVTVLRLLDPARWQVDLLLFEEGGPFREQVPPHVRVVPHDGLFRAWNLRVEAALAALVRARRWDLALERARCSAARLAAPSPAARARRLLESYRTALPRSTQRYAVAVAFLEGPANHFVGQCVDADRKIGWVHSNYGTLPRADRALDHESFAALDAIGVDSEQSRAVIARLLPRHAHKFHAVECPLSPALIRTLAAATAAPYPDDFDGARILTVARLSHAKGIDLAIAACARLKARGLRVRWYVVGDGEDRAALARQIESLGLRRDFVLLGTRVNPYPFIAACDVYVQPSRSEGWCIAVDEAKVLARPIVLARFPIAGRRVTHLETGLVVDLDPDALARGVATLIDDPGLRRRLTANLRAEELDGERRMDKLHRLLTAES